MKKLVLLLCLITSLFACKKDKTADQLADPATLTGSVSGSVSPAGIISVIYATDSQGKQFPASVATNGMFKFDVLPAGKYLINMPANPGLQLSGNINVAITGGQAMDAGVLKIEEAARTSGDIYGSLLPAGFGTGVTATELNSGKVYTAVPIANGFFTLNLPNGDYTVTFNAKAPVEVPADVKVTIAGTPVGLGSINCKPGTSGSITGTLSPYNGAGSVEATNTQTGDVISGTIDYSHGTFAFPVMFPGTYKISVTAYIPYLVPPDLTVVVATGLVTNAGTVTLLYNHDVKVLSFKADGQGFIRYDPACTYNGGLFKFTFQQISLGGGIPENTMTSSKVLSLAVANITGPGKYSLTGADNSAIIFTESSGPTYGTKTVTNWGISGTAAKGELEVTAIDPVARTIKGTFSATLVSTQTAANRSVTEGAFYLSY